MSTPTRNNDRNGSTRRVTPASVQSTPTRRRSNSVARQIPLPVSVQVFNCCPTIQEEGTSQKGRREYSSQLLVPIQAQLIVPSRRDVKKATEQPQILHAFTPQGPPTTAPVWGHLSEVIDWEKLDGTIYERVRMRFGTTSVENDEAFFLQIPLHPSHLIPCPALPADRPVNTAVVQFSDDTSRVTPAIWQQLPRQSTDQEDLLMFEEAAFAALESAAQQRPNLLDAAAEEDGDEEDNEEVGETETDLSCDQVEGFPSANFVATDSSGKVDELLRGDFGNLPTLDQAFLKELYQTREHWQTLVKQEQAALTQVQNAYEADQLELQDTLQELTQLQSNMQQIQQATREEETTCQRLRLQIEAQRIRLIKELRRIYPIVTDGKIWSIRGFALPRDLFSLSEDDLSAVLGMVCHAVSLSSRYLGVPLRYRLYCNSSRSAVQDDRGTVFPLFVARPVEREQVEWGLVLLERNVECIGQSRGMNWEKSPDAPVLEKMNMIYSAVVLGQF